jgi:hypothetical protein
MTTRPLRQTTDRGKRRAVVRAPTSRPVCRSAPPKRRPRRCTSRRLQGSEAALQDVAAPIRGRAVRARSPRRSPPVRRGISHSERDISLGQPRPSADERGGQVDRRRPGCSPSRFPAPILALPAAPRAIPRVTPGRNKRRIAIDAERENEHRSVAAQGARGRRRNVTPAREPGEAVSAFP